MPPIPPTESATERTTQVATEARAQSRTPGEIAYTAYCEHRGWKAFNGDPLPSFAEMKPDPKRADLVPSWEAAGHAVLEAKAGELVAVEIEEMTAAIDLLETRLGHVLAQPDHVHQTAPVTTYHERIHGIISRLVI